MTKRSIPMCILLSFVTCGIYAIYWYYCVANDFYNERTENYVSTTPVVTIILHIVTCGIYGIYTYYVWGKAMPEIFARRGRSTDDRSVIYLVLSLVGLQIVSMCLIQNDFNELADGGVYPPQGGQPYPPQGYAPQQPYPPQDQAYAPQGQPYPPQDQAYAPQAQQPYPPQGQQPYPQQGQPVAPQQPAAPPPGSPYSPDQNQQP